MRETFAHTQRLPEYGSARLQLRETRALAQREEKTIDLGAQFFLSLSLLIPTLGVLAAAPRPIKSAISRLL